MDPHLGSQFRLKSRAGDQSPADGGEGKAAASSALQNCSGSCSGSTHLRGIAPDALSTFKRNQALRLLEASPAFRGPFYGTPEFVISRSPVRLRRVALEKPCDCGAFFVGAKSYWSRSGAAWVIFGGFFSGFCSGFCSGSLHVGRPKKESPDPPDNLLRQGNRGRPIMALLARLSTHRKQEFSGTGTVLKLWKLQSNAR